jgi:hypothetical protein
MRTKHPVPADYLLPGEDEDGGVAVMDADEEQSEKAIAAAPDILTDAERVVTLADVVNPPRHYLTEELPSLVVGLNLAKLSARHGLPHISGSDLLRFIEIQTREGGAPCQPSPEAVQRVLAARRAVKREKVKADQAAIKQEADRLARPGIGALEAAKQRLADNQAADKSAWASAAAENQAAYLSTLCRMLAGEEISAYELSSVHDALGYDAARVQSDLELLTEARGLVADIAAIPERRLLAADATRELAELETRHRAELEAARKKYFATRGGGSDSINRLKTLAKRRPEFFVVHGAAIQLAKPELEAV